MRNFARLALQDEDVIELNASFTDDKSTSTLSLGSSRKKSGEEILWNIFQMIRNTVLASSRIPANSIWSRKSDSMVCPILSEAHLICGKVLLTRLLSLPDFLCHHYEWQKTGMARMLFNRREVVREHISHLKEIPVLNSDNSSENSLVYDHTGSVLSTRTLSRETAKLLTDGQPPSAMNWDYANSVSRLYILIHNIEDIFLASAYNSSHLYRVFSVLASCPVVSIIASVTSLNAPLYSGWGCSELNSFQWSYQHTPSSVPHETLPEIVTAYSNESRKASADRSDTLKYILKSLTKKHHEIIKYLLDNCASHNSDDSAATSCVGIGWFTLLSYAMSQFIVKGDSDLRQLVSELKDQRIVRTYSDRDSKVYVSLVLSPVERARAAEYYQATKKK